jgi:nitroimidazol reductase NimA-like FMN-containing flavoprotein (pyridoxamine 5'-phosphate oxidase superfamily)
LAAAFGKKKELEDAGEKKEKRWENVEKMEEDWTRRLISGGQPPWK